jgi:hypothetical protein
VRSKLLRAALRLIAKKTGLRLPCAQCGESHFCQREHEERAWRMCKIAMRHVGEYVVMREFDVLAHSSDRAVAQRAWEAAVRERKSGQLVFVDTLRLPPVEAQIRGFEN